MAVAPPFNVKPSFAGVIDANTYASSMRVTDKYVAYPAQMDDVIDAMDGRPIGETPFEYRSSEDAYDVIDGNIANAPQLTVQPSHYADRMLRISDRSD